MDSLHRVKHFELLFLVIFYDYGLQTMKASNSVSEKLKSDPKRVFSAQTSSF